MLPASTFLAAQTVRDSAGIRIVTNAKAVATGARQLKLTPAPSLIIGNRDEPPYQLSRVRGALMLSDGRIVIGDGSSHELRIYEASGTYLKSIGRTGSGPGEFRSLSRMFRLAGDTIAVIHDNASLSRFTSTGAFVSRTNDITARNGSLVDGTMKAPMIALNGGSRLVLELPFQPDLGAPGTRADALAQHKVVGASGQVVGQLGALPYMQGMAGKDGAEKPWLGAEEVFAGNGSQFYLGYGTSYSLTRYSAAGVPQLIIRREWKPTAISRRDITMFADEWLIRWSKKRGAELDRQRKDLINDDYAKLLPAFSAILLDGTGRLWVRAPKAIDGAVAGSLNDYSIGPSTWSVFDAAGRWLCDVTMPGGFAPTDIGANYVLGIARDDDGTPTVVRYALGSR